MKKIILIAFMASNMYATAAYKGPITFTQADGSHFQATLKGDEWFHWVQDSKGNIIQYNPQSKDYEYAKVQESQGIANLIPSGEKVQTGLNSLAQEKSIIDPKTLSDMWKIKKDKALSHTNKQTPCSTLSNP